MSDWKPIFVSKIRGDGYSILTGSQTSRWIYSHPAFKEVVEPMLEKAAKFRAEPAFIIMEGSASVCWGVLGRVSSILGEDHLQAVDRRKGEVGGRPKSFFLGYSAPKGTPLPSIADFGKLKERAKIDLERMFEGAELTWPNRNPNGDAPIQLTVNRPGGEGKWDQAVRSLESGRSLEGALVSHEGESKIVRFSSPAETELKKNSIKTIENTLKDGGTRKTHRGPVQNILCEAERVPAGAPIFWGQPIIGTALLVGSILCGTALWIFKSRSERSGNYLEESRKTSRRERMKTHNALAESWRQRTSGPLASDVSR